MEYQDDILFNEQEFISEFRANCVPTQKEVLLRYYYIVKVKNKLVKVDKKSNIDAVNLICREITNLSLKQNIHIKINVNESTIKKRIQNLITEYSYHKAHRVVQIVNHHGKLETTERYKNRKQLRKEREDEFSEFCNLRFPLDKKAPKLPSKKYKKKGKKNKN